MCKIADRGGEMEKQKHSLGLTSFMKYVAVLCELVFCLLCDISVSGIKGLD